MSKGSASYVFKRKISKKHLRDTFESKISNVKTIGFDRMSAKNFHSRAEDKIKVISYNLSNGLYNFVPYKTKLILKGKNKFPRELSIPTIQDRLVLKVISELLTEVFPNAKAILPQLKIKSVADEINKEKYDCFIKFDISNFYGDIPHDLLLKKIKTKVRKGEIIKIISDAISNATIEKSSERRTPNLKGVPQGLSISNILAEIYLNDFDKLFFSLSDIHYERYVDDVLILTKKKDLALIIDLIKTEMHALKLMVHPFNGEKSKSKYGHLSNESFDFLGYFFENKKVTPRSISIAKFENSLAATITAFKHKFEDCSTTEEKSRCIAIFKWKLNLKISGCIYEKKRLGWIFYFSQSNSSTPFRGIDSTVNRIIKRMGVSINFTPKRALKCFYEAKRKEIGSNKYILNLDNINVDQKRDILYLYLPKYRVESLSNDKIEKIFSKTLKESLKDLERDVGSIS